MAKRGDLDRENAELRRQLAESLAQQEAVAEVLQVINSSPGDLAPVFDAILDKAMRLCGVEYGDLELYDGTNFRAVATYGLSDAFAEQVRRGYPGADNPATRPLIAGERLTHIADLSAADFSKVFKEDPVADEAHQTLLCVPLRRDGRLLGMIASARKEVRPFSDKEIALLENFAAQAVIAMENARLITETREALEQQTATAEVLQVINSSPGDLAPVFDAMLEKATRLCEAHTGHLFRFEHGAFCRLASHGVPEQFDKLFPPHVPVPLFPGSGPARMIETRSVVHVRDAREDESYRLGSPDEVAAVEAGILTVLFVPLIKEGEVVGHFTMHRMEVKPFSDKQIALLQNFAAQAVIAMENARLLGETRQRTAELQESLEYQTATSDVLKIISRSPVDLGAVLDFVCDTAARLCQVTLSQIFLLGADGVYRWATGFGLEPAYREIEEKAAITPGGGTLVGRVALTGKTVHILDGMTDPRYEARNELHFQKCHTLLGVPLLRDGVVIGVICLARREIQGYSEKQMEVVTTFADQR